jgi:hypothetical protein
MFNVTPIGKDAYLTFLTDWTRLPK